MAVRGKNRQFPTAYKLKAIKRVERGEGVLPVARELGISRKILHDWIKAWKAHGPEGLNRKPGPKPGPRKLKPRPTYDDKRSALTRANARIAELERLVGRQQMDIDFFSGSLARIGAAGSARQTRIRIIEVIQAMTSEATDSHADVQRLCRLAGLPRATYYRHLNRHSRETVECELRDQLQRICLKHPFYGYRRVTATLRRQGMVVNAKKVLRLMREDNLLAQRKAPFLKPPAERPRDVLVVPNLVRGLVPSAPDQIWVADITYVHLAKTFAYLAVILDAFSRKAVGWAFENTLDASLAISALENALQDRKPTPGSLIHHSDRGVQYASIAYRQRLADRDITISMSRPGNPFDNAKAESFMKTLKAEEVNGKAFSDISDARRRIDSFIADVYNKERLHSALGYQSPLEFETAFAQNKAR